jgi:hypothetical protein
MFAVVVVATALVATVKAAVVVPAATVTFAGTWATELPLLRETVAPPTGATALRITVAVEEFPPMTPAGFRVSEAKAGGAAVTTRLAAFVVPYVAEIETVVSADTEPVVTLKVADVALAATGSVAETWATAVLLLDRVMTAPPVGAGPLSVTVPAEERPPCTVVGFRVTEATVTVVPPVP